VDDATIEYLRILRGDICSYCGKPAGTVDHIVPVASGGTNDWDNLTSACSSCNSRKHDRSLLAFLVKFYDE
jgi:5-methylcytosine-specific restriction endonuclease McrA